MLSRFLAIQLGLIFIFSSVAKYSFPDFNQSNWQTVLFLTPLGIIQNYLERDSSVLWSFYSDPSSGQVSLSAVGMGLMLAVYICLLANAFWFLKKKGQGS